MFVPRKQFLLAETVESHPRQTWHMIMHHALIILTVTFIQDHTDLKHETNTMFDFISETIQAMTLKFAV